MNKTVLLLVIIIILLIIISVSITYFNREKNKLELSNQIRIYHEILTGNASVDRENLYIQTSSPQGFAVNMVHGEELSEVFNSFIYQNQSMGEIPFPFVIYEDAAYVADLDQNRVLRITQDKVETIISKDFGWIGGEGVNQEIRLQNQQPLKIWNDLIYLYSIKDQSIHTYNLNGEMTNEIKLAFLAPEKIVIDFVVLSENELVFLLSRELVHFNITSSQLTQLYSGVLNTITHLKDTTFLATTNISEKDGYIEAILKIRGDKKPEILHKFDAIGDSRIYLYNKQIVLINPTKRAIFFFQQPN